MNPATSGRAASEILNTKHLNRENLLRNQENLFLGMCFGNISHEFIPPPILLHIVFESYPPPLLRPEGRFLQILAGQGIARPLRIRASREYPRPASICPTLAQIPTEFPAIAVQTFRTKKMTVRDSGNPIVIIDRPLTVGPD